MQLSLEILDHIFSFLVSDRETLTACSQDPVLFPLVERHFYYHIIVHAGKGPVRSKYAVEHSHLFRTVSENPRIVYYVKIVEVDCGPWKVQEDGPSAVENHLREFSSTLLMFPVLECIILIRPRWSTVFRAALVDRLNLPTVKEMHIQFGSDVPLSLLNNCKNIKHFSLSGALRVEAEGLVSSPHLPQLKSLVTVSFAESSSLLLDWLKLHVHELQSLKCGMQSLQMLPELLEACSASLTKLEVDLEGSSYHNHYRFSTGTTDVRLFPDISPLPRNLQQLTVRTAIYRYQGADVHSSWLLAAGKVISLFISSCPPRHLALDIDIALPTVEDLTEIDFSPLAVLGAASLSIPRIDLYVRTEDFPPALTRAQLLLSLEKYEGIATSIKEGVLFIHLRGYAPDCVKGDWASAPTYYETK